MPSYIIQNCFVDFPFEAQDQQQTYMKEFIKCMKKGRHCALEAPTGFGKTACVFAAYIGFCKQYERATNFAQLLLSLQQEGKRLSLLNQLELGSVRLELDQHNMKILYNFIQETSLLMNFIQCENNTLTIYPPSDENVWKVPKLFFASRTHEQLKQATKALFENFSNPPPISYLSSRVNYCQNDEALKRARTTNININTICKSLQRNKKCIYDVNDQNAVVSTDFEDFIEQSVHQHKCPFHQSRNQISSAQIVFTPYNYILDPSLASRQISQNLERSIVVFDEAHSIVEVCKQVFSQSFKFSDLEGAIANLRLGLKLVHELKMLRTKLGYEEESNEHDQQMKYIDVGLSMLKQIKLNIESLQKLGEKSVKFFFFQNVFDRITPNLLTDELFEALESVDNVIYNLKNDQNKPSYAPLYEAEINNKNYGKITIISKILQVYCQAISYTQDFHEFQIIQLLEDDQQGKEYKRFELVCFTPELTFKQLLNKNIRMCLMTSGTLSPLEHLENQLNCDFFVKESLGHFFDLQKQLKAIIVTQYDRNSNPLLGTFDNRKAEYFIDICKTICQITQSMPNEGILVFVNSYVFMNDLKSYLEVQMNRSNQHRNTVLMFEKEGVLQEYKDSVQKDKKRTILIAVQRGRISEGIDFSNELCRGVFIVSIPFPNNKDPVMQLNMQWLDKYGGKFKGNNYYMQQTFITVNQAIGRVVRNKDDYGVVYLLDMRFADNKAYLPGWIRNILQITILVDEKKDNFFQRQNNAKIHVLEQEIDLLALENSLSNFNFSQQIRKPLQKVLNAKQIISGVKEFLERTLSDQESVKKEVLAELKEQQMLERYESLMKQNKIIRNVNLAKLLKTFKSDQQIIFVLSQFEEEEYIDILSRFM